MGETRGDGLGKTRKWMKMHDEVLLAGGQGGLKAGKYHWMIHAYN